TSGNLFVGMGEFAESLYTSRNAVDAAWRIVRGYATFHGILAVGCTLWATLRLRAVALRQAFGRTRKLSVAGRHRPPIGEHPMLWKELYVEGGLRFNLASSILIALLAVATFVPLVAIIVDHTGPGGAWYRRELASDVTGWVKAVGAIAGCLML